MKVVKESVDLIESQTIGWISGGAASAIACWLEQQRRKKMGLPPLRFVRIDPLSEHPDTLRFVQDVADRLLEAPIETISVHQYGADRYRDCQTHIDVLLKDRFVRGPGGAPCTRVLKRQVRALFEQIHGINSHVWGFCTGEDKRATQMKAQAGFHHFPLLDQGVIKQDCFRILQAHGIEVPEMYRLGFNNNNCVGCVKGGIGYWNHVRKHFPEVFDRMCDVEAIIGATCLREVVDGRSIPLSLRDLDPNRGRHEPMFVEDCGSTGEVCEIQASRQACQDPV